MPLCCESYKIFVASRHWPKWATKISTVLHTLVLRAGIIRYYSWRGAGEIPSGGERNQEREESGSLGMRRLSAGGCARYVFPFAKLLLRLQVICRMRCPGCPLAAAAAAINAGYMQATLVFHFAGCRRIYKRCSDMACVTIIDDVTRTHMAIQHNFARTHPCVQQDRSLSFLE